MVTYGDIRRWRPEILEGAREQALESLRVVQDLKEMLPTMAPPKGWRGEAAGMAEFRHRQITFDTDSFGVSSGRFVDTLQALSENMLTLRESVQNLDRMAQEYGYTITDSGEVIDNEASQGEYSPLGERIRRELERRVSEIIDFFQDTDDGVVAIFMSY